MTQLLKLKHQFSVSTRRITIASKAMQNLLPHIHVIPAGGGGAPVIEEVNSDGEGEELHGYDE